jgi:hypothetical protein
MNSRSLRVLLAAAIVAAVAAVVGLVWVLAGDDGSSPLPDTTEPIAVTEQQLRDFADEVDRPVYWAGASDTETYELTRLSNGNVYIRYLAEGTEIGDPAPKYTTVVTYPSETAFATLDEGSKRNDATAFRFQSGALAVTYRETPTSVYFAFPDPPYLVEVFDPSPRRARQLVRSGQVAVIE